MRVRFAPSPTGPLHIGGVRTALYNYLLARKNGGTFILRIEDTDRTRFVPSAEKYIIDSLEWLGINPDESPWSGGDKGPYRQSERKDIYKKYNDQLISSKKAYICFDTPDELNALRADLENKGVHSPKYDHTVRMQMRNSLTLSESEVEELLKNNTPYVSRLKVEADKIVTVEDEIRGRVEFNSSLLDDKILVKSDGMPTYHMANIIDDHLMEITHVIRGEEWLPSTAHHILLYQAFGWADEMPIFAHLPLILKPKGSGKLSKRDGAKFNMPVFPLEWKEGEDHFIGFREEGFLPDAVINFLAFLGWNPGTEQEIFNREELISAFGMSHVGKSGARFDIQKARWYNQHYISDTSDTALAQLIKVVIEDAGLQASEDLLFNVADLMKDRLETVNEILPKASYLFKPPTSFDLKQLKKRWSTQAGQLLTEYSSMLDGIELFVFNEIEKSTKLWMEDQGIGFGQIMPILRLAVCGTTQGPDMFIVMEVLGRDEVKSRLTHAIADFPLMIT